MSADVDPPPPEEPAEKTGMRNAWGRIAGEYERLWTERTAPFTARGLDLLAPDPEGNGCDIACGPGVTARALADRLPRGSTLGLDFAPPMVAQAAARFAGPGLGFAVDDAERLSQPDAAFDVVTCSFGLMYCYDPRAALRHMARVLRPGGRLMVVVWGAAPRVWFSPVIDLIESRARYYASVCPMMFFYGLPGVLSRMVAETGLTVLHDEAVGGRMRFPSAEVAADAGILGGPLSGLYVNRLDPEQQREVRDAMVAHVGAVAVAEDGGLGAPAEVAVVVAEKASA
ncbi:MAG TPA: class I SAM-dependent methyltransferase [Candidatus Dormibacteraeota bacterium]